MSPKRLIYMTLAIAMMILGLYTIVDPTLCKSDCGFFLTRPLFSVSYWALGPWGTRLVFFLAALFFAWAAATEGAE